MELEYIGDELSLFENAKNWKSYWSSFLLPYLKGDVLEVGAGLGGTTQVLTTQPVASWTCLEPDAALVEELKNKINSGLIGDHTKVITGVLSDIEPDRLFDCIMYIDVIEHIEGDKAELENASQHLKPGGTLFVLVPAHQWLYSPFDKAIGHYRRYNKAMLRNAGPANLQLNKLKYLDGVGLSASIVNKFFLKQSLPTKSQIRFWDSTIVPLSRIVDPLTAHLMGKTVIGIWKKEK